MRRRVCAAIILLLVSVNPLWAQDERGFVRGLAGVTFGTETSSIVGGGFGVSVAPNLQVIGEVGRMQNVLPGELQDDLDFIANLLALELGTDVTLDANVPAFYGVGGVRYNVPTAGRVRPFVEGAVGFANLSFDIHAEAAGIDFSELVEDEADLETETEFLLLLGGGVGAALTDAVGVDVGYRYSRIFTDDPAINTSAIYAALRFGF